jgi:hypothetical protein
VLTEMKEAQLKTLQDVELVKLVLASS